MIGPEYPLIEQAIPNDHSRPAGPSEMLKKYGAGSKHVLDLGCGDGRGLDEVRKFIPEAAYVGVDIEVSPEVSSRIRDDGEFLTYDGVNLPFEDQTFDLVYSSQVFEHIRHPDQVASEVRRVLKPGGWFVGSLSNLEPYHSFSIFNYTPYGLFRLIDDSGLKLIEMRPGVEGISLIVRQVTNRKISGFRLCYPLIELMSRLKNWDAQRRNYLKLRLSGHIIFASKRPDDG